MKISCIIGGGVGDMILSMRFVAAVREKYPNSHITIYANDKDIFSHSDFIRNHWSYLFDEMKPIKMKSKTFQIRSQFGEENYPEAYSNIDDKIRSEIESGDKVYNLIPDALHYLEYNDIPWMKYTRCIPEPKFDCDQNSTNNGQVVLNLYAREGHPSYISKERAEWIISEIIKDNQVKVIAPSEEVKNSFYEKLKEHTVVATLDECLPIIKNCALGVSLDSGMRCIFHAFSKTCYTLTCNTTKYFEPPPSHFLRWYPWSENVIPLDAHPLSISNLVKNAIKCPANQLFPHINPEEMNRVILRRIYD